MSKGYTVVGTNSAIIRGTRYIAEAVEVHFKYPGSKILNARDIDVTAAAVHYYNSFPEGTK